MSFPDRRSVCGMTKMVYDSEEENLQERILTAWLPGKRLQSVSRICITMEPLYPRILCLALLKQKLTVYLVYWHYISETLEEAKSIFLFPKLRN